MKFKQLTNAEGIPADFAARLYMPIFQLSDDAQREKILTIPRTLNHLIHNLRGCVPTIRLHGLP